MQRRIEEYSLREFIQFKIITIGDAGVGKTSFLKRYTENVFEPDVKPTIGIDVLVKKLLIKNEPIQLSFYDTAGTERYASISDSYFKGASMCIIMYDVTRKSTFISCERWLTKLQSIIEDNITIIIIGNKTDNIQEREVSEEEGKTFAQKNKCYFIETSCLNGSNVNEAIDIVITHGVTDTLITSLKSSQIGKITPTKPLVDSYSDDNQNGYSTSNSSTTIQSTTSNQSNCCPM